MSWLFISYSGTIQFPSGVIVPNRLWRLPFVYNNAIDNRNGRILRTLPLCIEGAVPYLLAYKPPLCGPCETNALSQEGAYSKGGLISQISGTVLSKH